MLPNAEFAADLPGVPDDAVPTDGDASLQNTAAAPAPASLGKKLSSSTTLEIETVVEEAGGVGWQASSAVKRGSVASLQPPPSARSVPGFASEADDAREAMRELQEIKAKTMYQMLDEVQTSAGLKKVVYLTTAQAKMFDSTNVSVLLDTFEMSETKLIMILMYSLGGLAMVRFGVPSGVKDEGVDWREYIYQNTQPCMAFPTDSEGYDTEFRLEQFMSKVVVPLAAETNAIVVVTCYSCCSLGLAFGRAASLAKARYNGKLPFKSLTFASAQWLDGRIGKAESFANELCMKVPRWRQGYERIRHAMEVEFGPRIPDEKFDNVYDINPLLDNIIVVDGVREDEFGGVVGVDDGPKCTLEDFILSALTSRLPSVAFRSMQCGVSSMPKPSIVNLLEQSVPVLLLDVRKRPKLSTEEVEAANPKASIHVRDRAHMFTQAVVADTKVHEELLAVGRADNLDMARMAFMVDAIYGDGDPEASGRVYGSIDAEASPLLQPICRIIKHWHSVQQGGGAGPSEELLEKVVAYLVEAEMRANWFLLPDSKKAGTDMQTYFKEWAQDERMVNYNIFTSKHLFSGNICNLEAVKSTVSSLVRMDKLPKFNSLEACTVLQSAWCVVDICDYNRVRYWIAAQVLFFLQAATAVASTTVTVIYFQTGEPEPFAIRFNTIIFILALVSSLVAGISAFLNPSTRWRLLEAKMDKLHSHLWRFRTRTGAYELDPSDPKKPERILREVTREVRESIIASSDVGETTYHQSYPASVFKHGQFESTSDSYTATSVGVGEIGDNHANPLQPQLYIRFRVRPRIREYQKQLPQLGRGRTLLQGMLMLGTAASALLANLDFSAYVPIITSVLSGITAWLEFHNTESKIVELNAAVMQLENLVMWWDSMTEIERAAQETINELVDLGESWIAAARKDTNHDKGKDRDEGDKDKDDNHSKHKHQKAMA